MKRSERKCGVVPVVSILCVLAFTSVNVYLVASIIALENQGGGKGRIIGDARPSLPLPLQRPLARETRKDVPTSSRSVKGRSSGIKVPEEPPTESSWSSSPHLVNCRKLAKSIRDREEEDGGMYMPIHCPSPACLHSQFFMNLHNPVMDEVSYRIFKEGCFECDHLTKLLNALEKYPDSRLVDIGGNIGMWGLGEECS